MLTAKLTMKSTYDVTYQCCVVDDDRSFISFDV